MNHGRHQSMQATLNDDFVREITSQAPRLGMMVAQAILIVTLQAATIENITVKE